MKLKSNKPSSLGFLPQSKRTSLADTIADTIAQAIADRNLAPGDRIIEVAFAAKLNVSRVPVREALKILHTQGVLISGRQGYEVAAFDEKVAAQVHEARVVLESRLLRDAVVEWREGRASLAPLDEALARMKSAVASRNLAEIRRSDMDFHRAICLASNNQIIGTLWTAIARHVLIVLNVPSTRRIDLKRMVQHHQALRDYITLQIEEPGPLENLKAALEAHFVPNLPVG